MAVCCVGIRRGNVAEASEMKAKTQLSYNAANRMHLTIFNEMCIIVAAVHCSTLTRTVLGRDCVGLAYSLLHRD